MALIRSTTHASEWSNYNLNDYDQQKKDFLKDIQVEAEAILKRANDKTEEIAKSAYQEGRKKLLAEIESLKEQAEKEGYEKGLKQGEEKGYREEVEKFKAEADPLLELLKNVTEEFSGKVQETLDDAETKLVEASMDLAKAVLGVEPKYNQEVLISRLKKAMSYLKPELELSVRLHPDDVVLAKKLLPRLLDELGSSPSVKWLEDPKAEKSSVLVRAGESEVQFNQFIQWEKLLTLLKQKSQEG
jgi:flagellar assembly protein FliH